MRFRHSCLFLFLLLAACSSDKKNHQANQASPGNKQHLNFQISGLIQPDSSSFLLIPLSMGETPEEGIIESRSYKEFSRDYWNIVFYNPSTKEFHLLDDSGKMVIHSYDMQKNQNNEKDIHFPNIIFYTVTTLDYNEDKKLTSEDPAYLFISDKDGRNFRQISPDSCQLNSFQMIRNSTHLIMEITRDSNRDLSFDSDDEKTAFEIDLSSTSAPTEIFSPEFKNTVKDLFEKNWKRNE